VKRIATRLGSRKIRAMRLDASKPEELRRGMEGCQLVVNAALPRFNEVIKRAALDSGLHYMDLATESADPYTPSQEWKDAGLTALLGMGEDPGMSNVMARRAADQLDTVESIKVRDGDTASSPEYPFIPLFSPETFVEETLSRSRIWRNGRYEMVEPFGAFEMYDFPPPVGSLPVYSVDHEEVDSLPRFIGKGVEYVDFKLALDAATMDALRRFQAILEREKSTGRLAEARKTFFASLPKPADLTGKVDGYAALVVSVTGTKDGRRLRHALWTVMGHREASQKYGATGTAYLTGTPAAVGAILLASGRIRERGILSPEHLDPGPFFRMTEDRGIRVHEEVGPVT